MNYYEHHIGDYAEATAHLSFLEDAAYSRCIRKYYATEKPLPEDMKAVQRVVGARTKDERAAVEMVLREFFYLGPDGWHQKRCDSDIARYVEKQGKARASANARWSKQERNADAMRTHAEEEPQDDCERIANAMLQTNESHDERNAHQTPDTKHHTPTEKKGARKRTPGFDAAAIDVPEWLSQDLWRSWCSDRKARGKAITEDGARLQLKKLGEYRDAGTSPDSVLEHAMASGNQGLYPPPALKANGHANGHNGHDRTDRRLHTAGLMTGTIRPQAQQEIIDVAAIAIPS